MNIVNDVKMLASVWPVFAMVVEVTTAVTTPPICVVACVDVVTVDVTMFPTTLVFITLVVTVEGTTTVS